MFIFEFIIYQPILLLILLVFSFILILTLINHFFKERKPHHVRLLIRF